MTFSNFQITPLPKIIFGEGTIDQLAACIRAFGTNVLIVYGAKSFCESKYWFQLQSDLENQAIKFTAFHVVDEPSTTLIDQAVSDLKTQSISVVVAIGGGSVIDAAKAIAGLLPFGNSILDHLEGVGSGIEYTGPALPFIAVPTTAGTGSEVTKNAVISERGMNGYKKSFRHETLVPKIALIDPALLASCSAKQIAANGMDAFTQLIESYVSIRANRITDALALDGINAVIDGFEFAWKGGDSERAKLARTQMAYASMISGITLAQVGLGSVHGLASPLGAFFPIPHGVVCGTLVAQATKINIEALLQREKDNIALAKYARVGRMLTNNLELNEKDSLSELVHQLKNWTSLFNLPRLSHFGISKDDFEKIVSHSRGSSMKTNPIVLTDNEIELILDKRL